MLDMASTQTPHSCVITYADSPDLFYIATPEMHAEKERIAESMWKEFHGAPPVKNGEQLDAADLFAVYHKGKFWRAIKYQKPCDDDNGLIVFLVDRGEFIQVQSSSNIYNIDLDHSLRKIDPLCVRAHLGDVIPMREQWSRDSKDFFSSNVRREDLKAILRGEIHKRDGNNMAVDDAHKLSMPLELLFTEAFTETPFHPEKRIETTMSALLLREGHAKVRFGDPDGNVTVPNVEGERELEKTKWEPEEKGPAVTRWLPPLIPEMPRTIQPEEGLKVRISHVDPAFQLYGHLRSNRTLLNSMKAYFSTCDLEDNEDDVKEVWNVGEACVARLGNEWYRAQVLEVNGSETAVVFVDLGNVRRIACRDLRIPRAYGDQPILAFRMVLDGIVAPDDSVSFTGQTIPEIEKELAYWKTNKTARVARSRKEAPTAFPIPVRLFRLQKTQGVLSDVEGQVEEEEWENYGETLVFRGMAAYGDVDLKSAAYNKWARGIEPDGLTDGMYV